ncbi:nucleotidyltransferase domain-containing protein [Fulvivirgaceae bacterium BMA10]|uniref:Nucleotidyltransferase domain-containing protein n=1 Tax=Splendidivirga corallicola TaxID=3051826 RepID=A0ABT8KLP4_9BACT|nr:nucleotidyltransferase domain-containing protein [Fulvivirgaceae bacterium BMA10]
MSSRRLYQSISKELEFSKHGVISIPEISLKGPFYHETITINKLSENEKVSLKWYDQLKSVCKEGIKKEIIENIVVHGSYGDLTFTNYSDLDLTVILSTETLTKNKLLLTFKRWFHKSLFPTILKIDPLQHHGVFYLWNELIENYSQAILPIDVYRHAWAFKQVEIQFRYDKLGQNQSDNLSLITSKKLELPKASFFKQGYSMYFMKQYLSNLMLLPAFYMTDIGKPTYKKDSFEPFYNEFKDLARPIEIASNLRKEWPKTPSYFAHFASKLSTFPKLKSLRKVIYKNRRIERTIKNEIIPNMPILTQGLKRKLQN